MLQLLYCWKFEELDDVGIQGGKEKEK